uniref:Uncharacterized protein n=1 Tax=Knipowitschia caucasica TaxID=637954 RepID=A0AAV2J502_KNICA
MSSVCRCVCSATPTDTDDSPRRPHPLPFIPVYPISSFRALFWLSSQCFFTCLEKCYPLSGLAIDAKKRLKPPDPRCKSGTGCFRPEGHSPKLRTIGGPKATNEDFQVVNNIISVA